VILDPLRIVIDTRPGGPATRLAHSSSQTTESTSRGRRRPSSWRSSLQEPRPTSSGPRAMSSKEAFFSGTEVVPASDAIGRVSADTPEANEFLQATIRVPFGHVRGGGVSGDMSHTRVTI